MSRDSPMVDLHRKWTRGHGGSGPVGPSRRVRRGEYDGQRRTTVEVKHGPVDVIGGQR